MASKLIVVLALAFVVSTFAAPAPTTEPTVESTTDAEEDVYLVEEIEIKDIPIVVAILDPTVPLEPEAKETTVEPEHKVVKRSAVRGDNPSNDLLANLDGVQLDNGLSGLDGRRIKFLPTWVG